MHLRSIGFVFILLLILTLTLFLIEPALANKFETIGSGVSGSTKIKIEHLKLIAFVAGAIMFIAGVLSVVTRDKNSQSVNYTMWKASASIFFLLSFLAIGSGFYL